ncbi:hypothetical protein AB0M34_21130 [Nocardia sp. NPDC050193]
MTEPHTPDRLPGARPTVPLAVTLLAGAVGICATMTFAADWARDLPKTIAFAVAQEPFGTRSMLNTDNARAGLDRALAHVPDGDRIISLTIDEDHVRLATIDRNGQYFNSTAEITGEVEAYRAQLVRSDRGITPDQLAAINVTAALAAAARRWTLLREQLVPPLERLEPPMVRLDTADGNPRVWKIVFTSEVPQRDRTSTIDLSGAPIE